MTPNPHSLLIVDDEKHMLGALQRILKDEGFRILSALSGEEGLKILKHHPEISLILCDQRMPGMTGGEMLEKARAIAPHAIRMLLTGYSDIEAVIEAINKGGIYRYLTKPWENAALKLEIKKALEFYELQQTVRDQHEKLKALDKAKDQFLMLISHELNTPLTMILSFTESYLRGLAQTNEERQHFIERIHEGGLRLKELIDETIDLVEAQTKPLSPKKTTFNLENLFQEIISDIHDKAIEKKITIENTIKDIKLHADQSLMKKNFSKLLHYAIRSVEEKTHIWLSAKRSDVTKNKIKKGITLTISYHGERLTAAQHRKIFSPFLIVGDILKHKTGAGLGLPLCRAIIEAHNGTISLSSSPSKRTLIEITLPRS